MLKPSKYWILPEWAAAPHVRALTTLRGGGHSLPPYDSFNLALHVGDDPKSVLANRELLKKAAALPAEPVWLNQTHSNIVIDAGELAPSESTITADASIARQPNQVCVVLTGDCLPILLCDQSGTQVAAIHAGWRGLAGGIVENTLKKLTCNPKNLLAWLGPAIGPESFVVQEDLVAVFKDYYSPATFRKLEGKQNAGVWLADLYQLARERLYRLGVREISGGSFCTYQESEQFYSFRRAKTTGRMATLIWLETT